MFLTLFILQNLLRAVEWCLAMLLLDEIKSSYYEFVIHAYLQKDMYAMYFEYNVVLTISIYMR